MSFDKNYYVDIKSLISSEYKFYAHKKENCNETLYEHTILCNKYFKQTFRIKNLQPILNNIEEFCLNGFSIEAKNLFYSFFVNVTNFHDLGKINPMFQSKKMENDLGKDVPKNHNVGKKHSMLSSLLYLDYFWPQIKNLENKDESKKLKYFLLLNAYAISRHHTDLNDFWEFIENFTKEEEIFPELDLAKELFESKIYLKEVELDRQKLNKMAKFISNYIKEMQIKENSIYFYTYIRLVYSLLVASDFYATSNFESGAEINSVGEIKEISEFYDVYKETEVYKSIREYQNSKYPMQLEKLRLVKDINILRCEMFLDAEKGLEENINEDIFFLEGPTGSGKSNVAVNLSYKLLEKNSALNKIFYVYPFNTLVEQNIESLKKIYKNNESIFEKIAVINSIYPIKEMREIDEDSKKYYSEVLLDRQFLNYPFILTTHVSLFDIMFGTSKDSLFGFHQLANSVIVLDEIQSYNNHLWTEIIVFLKKFAAILNIKIIIMSATLPDFNILTPNIKCAIKLINDTEKYFKNPIFKSRVNVNYELLKEGKFTQDKLIEEVKKSAKGKKKILVEFISRQTAKSFYKAISENDNIISSKIELMTGEDSIVERERILNEINSEYVALNGMILVATQVVEAGVDIDMDIGYKDISKLDSEEQFMGRINRSCKKDGIVYFFDMDNAKTIFKKDFRISSEFNLQNTEMQNILENKDFRQYYTSIMRCLKEKNEEQNDDNILDFWNEDVKKLKFQMIKTRMQLINNVENNIRVFFNRTLKLNDGKTLHGSEVWNDYKNLLNDNKMEYSEKKVKLSQVRSKMNYFIHEISNKLKPNYQEQIGELYYVEEGKKVFINNKLDIDKLKSENMIL